jgi:hypothetical protein
MEMRKLKSTIKCKKRGRKRENQEINSTKRGNTDNTIIETEEIEEEIEMAITRSLTMIDASRIIITMTKTIKAHKTMALILLRQSLHFSTQRRKMPLERKLRVMSRSLSMSTEQSPIFLKLVKLILKQGLLSINNQKKSIHQKNSRYQQSNPTRRRSFTNLNKEKMIIRGETTIHRFLPK